MERYAKKRVGVRGKEGVGIPTGNRWMRSYFLCRVYKRYIYTFTEEHFHSVGFTRFFPLLPADSSSVVRRAHSRPST